MAIDKNYKLIQFTANQQISKNDYTVVFDATGEGILDCIVFAVNDTDMKIIVEIDGDNVVDEFLLKNFSSKYRLEKKGDYDLPLTSIDDKTFKYRPRVMQEFSSNISIKLKHSRKSDKKLEVGYITYQKL